MQLMILEVSQKQAYIFAPRTLSDNCARSRQIVEVTSPEFFLKTAPEFFEPGNLVYSGGGHTVLQFPDAEQATAFARRISRTVLETYPGMELYIRQRPYEQTLSPARNLQLLSQALEEKKSLRQSSFRSLSLGIEGRVRPSGTGGYAEAFAVEGWKCTKNAEEIAGNDNFLAVVHLDGNSMGKRVQGIYDTCGDDWQATVQALRTFSSQIDTHFEEAFRETVGHLTPVLESDCRFDNRILPVRKLIGAGDDVCFITQGYLGLDFAADFLQNLSAKVNAADGKHYSACAGVVLMHVSDPFRPAYDLSEALCGSAKSFVAEYGGDFNALDYHIEYGQMRDSLTQIRGEYVSEDGCVLTRRPLAVTEGVPGVPEIRSYRGLVQDLKVLTGSGIARSKIKGLRTPLHQGALETDLAIRMGQSGKLLSCFGVNSTVGNDEVRRRLFDAIELTDRVEFWRN